MRPLFVLLLSATLLATPASAGTGSLFLGGLTFFDTADLDRTAEDLGTADLSPGFDSDFLLSFGAGGGTSVLAGFGLFWSRRSEPDDGISFTEDPDLARFEVLGFPFTAGLVHRRGAPDESGFAWGILAHWYFLKISVRTDPADSVRGGFRIGLDGGGERDADGPGLSFLGAYEIPYPLGRAGAGIRLRWTSLGADPIPGCSDPEITLNGISFFLSVSFL